MKSFSTVLFLLICQLTSWTQQTVTLSGHIDHPKGNMVYVKQYQDYMSYAEIMVDSAKINKKGDFKMTFAWPDPGSITFYHGDEITDMYLCPGDNLHLSLDTKLFDETLVYKGVGSERNTYCAQKMLESEAFDPTIYKKNGEDFTSYMDSVRAAKRASLNKFTSANGADNTCTTAFKDFEMAEIEYEWASNLLDYPMMSRYLNQNDPNAIIQTMDDSFLQKVQIDNPHALSSPMYASFVTQYVEHEVNKIAASDKNADLTALKAKFITDHLKGPVMDFAYANLIHEELTYFGDTTKAAPLLRNYKAMLPNGKYTIMLEEVMARIMSLSAGNMAPNFTAEDLDDKSYSLQDFRGKIVYLDIWATWCGPCVSEIPSMEKLISAFEGEDIVFMSVSVDDDEARWKKFVGDKKMGGVQLHSPGGFEASIAKLYAVVGIPRYILIDQQGKIIDGNADRPGSIRDKLNELLDQ